MATVALGDFELLCIPPAEGANAEEGEPRRALAGLDVDLEPRGARVAGLLQPGAIVAARRADSDPARVEELHNMRIAAKRLRYTLEIFAPCFTGKDFSKLYEQVKSVQEQIGEIHDRDVRGPLLQSFMEGHMGGRPEIRVGLERLIQAQQSERAKLYRTFIAYWNKLQKQGFKRNFLQMLVQSEAEPMETSVEESVTQS